MNFTNVKELTIPEGKVVTIVNSNGGLVWAPDNLINYAVAEPGGTTIYEDIGYSDEYRWSSSGGGLVDGSSYNSRVSGWVPCLVGITYVLNNFYPSTGYCTGCYIIVYRTNGTVSCRTFSASATASDLKLTYSGSIGDSTDWLRNPTITLEFTDSTIKYWRISSYNFADRGGGLPPTITIQNSSNV